MPELERRLIINLYWRQHATVRWNGEVSREVKVERGEKRVFNIIIALQFIQRVHDKGSNGKYGRHQIQ